MVVKIEVSRRIKCVCKVKKKRELVFLYHSYIMRITMKLKILMKDLILKTERIDRSYFDTQLLFGLYDNLRM